MKDIERVLDDLGVREKAETLLNTQTKNTTVSLRPKCMTDAFRCSSEHLLTREEATSGPIAAPN